METPAVALTSAARFWRAPAVALKFGSLALKRSTGPGRRKIVMATYVCQKCSSESIFWLEECPSCGEHLSLKDRREVRDRLPDTSVPDSIQPPQSQLFEDFLFRLGFFFIFIGVLIFIGVTPRRMAPNPFGAAWVPAIILIGIGLCLLAIDRYLNG